MSQNSSQSKNKKPQGGGARRDFLKLSAAAIGSVALQPIIVQARFFSAAGSPPNGAIIADDQDKGAFLPGGPGKFWWPTNDPGSYGGKMVYTYNTDTPPSKPTNWAEWVTPPLTVAGEYTVYAYIPLVNAETHGALYQIANATGGAADPNNAPRDDASDRHTVAPALDENTVANGMTPVKIDQAVNKGKWVGLGAYTYNAGDVGKVYLDDVVPETKFKSVKIAYDAIAWLPPGVNWSPGVNLVPYDPLWAQNGMKAWMGRGGEPVSTALGNFYTQHQDLFVPGPGISVDFTRAYNSLDPHKGAFGLGWTYTYGISAIDRGNGQVIVTLADGRAGLYEPDGSSFTSPKGFLAKLAKNGDEFILSDVDQLTYTFKATNGKLKSIADLNGNRLTFEYTESNYVLTDAVGRKFKVKTKDDKYIEEITDPIGRVYKFEYDGDKLIKFTNAEGGEILYTYNGDDLLETITDPNDHKFVTNHYDSKKRVDWQKDVNGSTTTFAYQGNFTTIVDNEGHKTIHEYDDDHRLTRETDHLRYSMVYGYDVDNNRNYIKDRGGHETFLKYDKRGNVLEVKDALSQVATFTYNNQNRMIFRHDVSGAETMYKYDNTGINLEHIHDAEGGDTYFEYYPTGLLKLKIDAEKHPTQFTYDGEGNLETVTDALTHVTSFKHDQVGRRTRMTDDNQHTVKFEYDANDRVKIITDPKKRTTKFEYDKVGNLRSVKDRRDNFTRYEYYNDDTLRQVTDPREFSALFTYDKMYHRTSFTNRRQFETRYEYDEVYNLKQVTDAKENIATFEYYPDRLLKQVNAPLEQITTYEYDELHRVKKVTDALKGTTDYTYDDFRRIQTRRDPNTALTQFEFDKLGRLRFVTDALQNVTEMRYDKVGNRRFLINARDNQTEYKYNPVNQLVEQIDPLGHSLQWNYDGVGNVITMVDRRNNATSFKYDENDNLIEIHDVLNGTIKFTYDAEDARETLIDQNGHKKTFTYDATGNLTSIQLHLGQTTRFEYDGNGNQTKIINAKTNATSFEYDKLDLLTKRTTPLGKKLGYDTNYQYDELRRMVKMIDAENHPTRYGYDLLNRLTTVEDALTYVTKYEYDPVGNLLFHTDANQNITEFQVDLLGRVTDEFNPRRDHWQYQYDEVGNRTQRVDANGVTTDYIFDKDDRLVEIRYPSAPKNNVTLDYDENNNLVKVTDPSGAEEFKYDKLNRLEQAERKAGILQSKLLQYRYDPVGNRKKVIYPDGKTAQYTFNENDWLVDVDDPGPLTGLTHYERDPLGLPTKITYPNGTWADYVYDDDVRLTKLFNGKPLTSTNIISSFEYEMDKVGNRKRVIEQATRGQAITWTKEYDYDALYRLLKAVETPDTNPLQVLTSQFEYDAVGNRKKQITNIADKPNTPALPAAAITAYDYDKANRLTSFVTDGGQTPGATSLAYDNNGNRLSLRGPARAIDYSYDFENRLQGAKTYDVLKNKLQYDSTLDFTYDGLGRRRERGVVDKGARKIADYLYDGLGYDLLAQYVDPGSPRTTYYYRDPMQVLSRHEIQGAGNGLQYFHHYDGLGSVSAWTGQNGREVQEYTYAPYGRLIDNNGPDNASSKTDPHNSLTFSSKLWDQETELYHFGARDYDPAAGVWLTQDPYRGRLAEPMTLHRYGYVRDNPINRIDHYGFNDEISSYLKEHNVQIDSQASLQAYPSYGISVTGSFSANTFGQVEVSRIYIVGIQSNPSLKSVFGGEYSAHFDQNGDLVTRKQLLFYQKVVENAKKMIGSSVNYGSGRSDPNTTYMCNGLQCSELVCIDVPVISVKATGIDLQERMKSDYSINNNYPNGNPLQQIRGYNNNPENPQFYRRVPNVATYLRNQGLYHDVNSGFIPKPGMLIVYDNPKEGREYHSAIINEVDANGKVISVISTTTPGVQVVQEKTIESEWDLTVNGYGEWHN